MEDKVSIIVPVYNAENVLRNCIDSILSQSYTPIELILVDDGSTDNSGHICDEYNKLDDRVVVIHQGNSGVSGARNTGIEAARGMYFVFVDSDDELLPEALKTGMRQMAYYTADVFIGGYFRNDYSGQSECALNRLLIGRISDTKEKDIVSLFEKNYVASCWGKIYRKEIVGDTRFDISMKFGEDLKFNIEIMTKDPIIVGSSLLVYKYIATDSSLTSCTDEQKCKNVIETYNILYKYGFENQYYSEGYYFTYLDKRWKNDLITLENMILQEDMSVISKYKRIQILCSDKQLIDRLLNIPDKYVTGFAVKPIKVLLGYLVKRLMERVK